MSGIEDQNSIDGEFPDSTRRVPDPACRPEKDSSRAVILFFALGILCSFSTIGIGIFGTANVADWRFPTVAARWTARAEERHRAVATLARQTDIAAETKLTETAVPPADRAATSKPAALQAELPANWPPHTLRYLQLEPK